jgi:hypothetical protein
MGGADSERSTEGAKSGRKFKRDNVDKRWEKERGGDLMMAPFLFIYMLFLFTDCDCDCSSFYLSSLKLLDFFFSLAGVRSPTRIWRHTRPRWWWVSHRQRISVWLHLSLFRLDFAFYSYLFCLFSSFFFF